MAILDTGNIIQLGVDISQLSSPAAPGAINNAMTGQPPAGLVATDWQFQLWLFYSLNSQTPLSVSNLSQVQLDIKNPNAPNMFTSPSLWTGIVTAANLSTCTYADWTGAKASPSLTASMTNLQSNFAVQANTTYTLVISATTTDVPAKLLFLGTTPLIIWPSGLGVTGVPVVNNPSYYTTTQSDARYPVVVASITNGVGNAALGTNCPSLAPGQPAAWVKMTLQGPGGPTFIFPGWTPLP